MYPPNDELHRYHRTGTDPYNAPVTGRSTRSGLIAMLIILMLLGGLIAYSSLSSPPAQTPAAVGTEAPDSVIGGGATESR